VVDDFPLFPIFSVCCHFAFFFRSARKACPFRVPTGQDSPFFVSQGSRTHLPPGHHSGPSFDSRLLTPILTSSTRIPFPHDLTCFPSFSLSLPSTLAPSKGATLPCGLSLPRQHPPFLPLEFNFLEEIPVPPRFCAPPWPVGQPRSPGRRVRCYCLMVPWRTVNSLDVFPPSS